jgi:glycosyltransferase involved in cell wall biosynthesis
MRKAVIDGRLLGYRYGGIANYAFQLARRIPRWAGTFELNVALSRSLPDLDDRGIRTITPPHHRFERALFGAEMAIRRPTLLHSVDYVPPHSLGFRRISTVHDLAFLEHPELVTRDSYAYYRQILDVLPEIERVIAVSPATRDRILERIDIDPDRVRMVPNGFDPDLFGPEPDNDMATIASRCPGLAQVARDQRPIVLAVGTIEPRKRYEILLDVMDQHWDQLCDLAGIEPVFVIAGQRGWLSDDVVARMRRQIGHGRLFWIRDASDEELGALYRSASLMVTPSLDEGFGLPVLEAMASGTASLVANTGALPWLVADCGFIEDTDVPEAWSEKIGMILADQEIRSRRAMRGLKRAQEFTWDETARQTAEVYNEVIND